MDPSLLQLGTGGLLLLLVLERVYSIIKVLVSNRKIGNGNGIETARTLLEILQEMQHQIADLHEWHKKEDKDGRKVWYAHSGVDRALEQIAATQLAQTKLLEHLVRSLEGQQTSVNEMQRSLADLYTNITSYRETICPFRESINRSKPRE